MLKMDMVISSAEVFIFSVGKIIYWAGKFGQWAGLIYWAGKINSFVNTQLMKNV